VKDRVECTLVRVSDASDITGFHMALWSVRAFSPLLFGSPMIRCINHVKRLRSLNLVRFTDSDSLGKNKQLHMWYETSMPSTRIE